MSGPQDLQRILLIDDDDFIRDIYTKKFSEADLTVDTAQGGEAGLEMLRNQETNYDVVLIDIIMPNMDGLQFLKTMRQEGLAGSARVIVLSNQGQPDDIEAAEAYDVDGYIIKANKVPSEVLDEITDIYHQSHA